MICAGVVAGICSSEWTITASGSAQTYVQKCWVEFRDLAGTVIDRLAEVGTGAVHDPGNMP